MQWSKTFAVLLIIAGLQIFLLDVALFIAYDKYIKNLFRLQKAQAAVSATDSTLSAADSKLNKELKTLNLSPETTDIRCSFCGKHSDLCRKVIAGPKEVYICDECVDLCHEILEEELRDGDMD